MTEREVQVIGLVADGLSNAQIAARLGITVNTVKSALTRMFARLHATDRAHTAAMFLRSGLVESPPCPTGYLSHREVEVLQAVADGCATTGTGARLCISERTVKQHLARIGAKYHTGSRARMVANAYAQHRIH